MSNNDKLPRQLRRQTTAFRGHPLQLPWQPAAIATAISAATNGNGHVNRRQFPLQSAARANSQQLQRQSKVIVTTNDGMPGGSREGTASGEPDKALLVCITKNDSKRRTWYVY